MADNLGLKTSELKLCSSYTRTEIIGGYNSHLRLPRQQWPAIASGSVFVFKAEKTLDQERLLQLEHNGLLFLTLRDFWHGHAALGGETSNGRGTLQGVKAELQLKRRKSSKTEWEFSQYNSGMTLVGCSGDASFLECCVKKAQSPPEHPVGKAVV